MGPTAGERQEENNTIPVQTNPTTRSILIAHHNRTPQKCELQSRIKIELPDIICITELYPQFSKTKLSEASYSIADYDMIMTNNGRGIMIYTANHLKIHNIETEIEVSEHLWIKVNISKGHCILVGTIYQSPNSKSENNDKLCSLLWEVSKIKHDHIIINGDFNMKQITGPHEKSVGKNSFQYKSFDTINGIFLCDDVKQPTRMRGSDKPSPGLHSLYGRPTRN